MKAFLKDLFTDALGRPEVKTVLGLVSALASIVYIFMYRDAVGFGALSGFAATMLVTSAVGDSVIDRKDK